jgi:hypothetical protein
VANRQLKKPYERSKDLKKKIVKLAQKKAKKPTAGENEADAILIGLYAVERITAGKFDPSKKVRHRKRGCIRR